MADAINVHPSPLRYPGGKGDVVNYIKLLFLCNNLIDYHYVELYAGGAGVALSLLFEEYASEIHINDLNRSVYSFWNAVLNSTDDLCRLIQDTPVTMETWHQQKAVQRAAEPEPLDLGFSTFFLNRTNRSGILNGGVIGGQEQIGEWKLDARYNKPNLIRRIRKIARYGSRINLTQRDAGNYLQHDLQTLPENTFFYFDPPYYIKGAHLYENFYKESDHRTIAEFVQGMTRPWVVSYDAVPEVIAMYERSRDIRYNLSYSASERYIGSEVMFFSPLLILPDVLSPAKIPEQIIRAERANLLAAQLV